MAKRIVRGALLLALALGTFANAEGQDQETTPAVSTAGEEESACAADEESACSAPAPYDNDVKPAAPAAGTQIYDPAGLLSPDLVAEIEGNLTTINKTTSYQAFFALFPTQPSWAPAIPRTFARELLRDWYSVHPGGDRAVFVLMIPSLHRVEVATASRCGRRSNPAGRPAPRWPV